MTFKDRYLYLDCFGSIQTKINEVMTQHTAKSEPISISVKLDDEGVVLDVWQKDECVATACKLYTEFGVRAMFFDSHVQPLPEKKDE